MKDKLFGKPIIELPQDHRDVRIVKMQSAELILKAAFEVRLKELRSKNLAVNDGQRNLRYPMAQLTRLRQKVAGISRPVLWADTYRMTANADTIAQQMIVSSC
jgi:hypothetical protein